MVIASASFVLFLVNDTFERNTNKYQPYYDAVEMLNQKYNAHMQIKDEKKLDNFTVEEFISAVERSYLEVEDIDKDAAAYEVVPIN